MLQCLELADRRPNWTRVLRYSSVVSLAACMAPTASQQTAAAPRSYARSMSASAPSSRPSKALAGTCTFVSVSSAAPRSSIICTGRRVTPGALASTRNSDTSAASAVCPRGAGRNDQLVGVIGAERHRLGAFNDEACVDATRPRLHVGQHITRPRLAMRQRDLEAPFGDRTQERPARLTAGTVGNQPDPKHDRRQKRLDDKMAPHCFQHHGEIGE